MEEKRLPRELWVLVVGDVLVLGLVTVFGFRFHQMSEAGVGRMLATFAPWLLGWLLAGVPTGVFDTTKTSDWRELWRPLWVMALASPLAGVLRGVWLGVEVRPIFVFVMAGVSGLAMLAWRGAYWLVRRNRG